MFTQTWLSDLSPDQGSHPRAERARGVGAPAPALAEPAGDAFTAAEREQIRLMTNWTYGNPAVTDEANQGVRNLATVEELTYPSDLPMLSFIKQKDNQPRRTKLHEIQLENLEHGELVELDGSHYLHWTHSPATADKFTEFLNAANR